MPNLEALRVAVFTLSGKKPQGAYIRPPPLVRGLNPPPPRHPSGRQLAVCRHGSVYPGRRLACVGCPALVDWSIGCPALGDWSIPQLGADNLSVTYPPISLGSRILFFQNYTGISDTKCRISTPLVLCSFPCCQCHGEAA